MANWTKTFVDQSLTGTSKILDRLQPVQSATSQEPVKNQLGPAKTITLLQCVHHNAEITQHVYHDAGSISTRLVKTELYSVNYDSPIYNVLQVWSSMTAYRKGYQYYVPAEVLTITTTKNKSNIYEKQG